MPFNPGEEKVNFQFKALTGYDNGRDVFLIYRNNTGERSIRTYRGYPWYFAVESQYYNRIKDLENIKGFTLVPEGDKYIRIYCPKVYDLKDQRLELRKTLEENQITPLEFDCSLIKRFMVDNLINVETDLKIAFFDIETDDTIGNIEIGRDRIISWAICNQSGEPTYFHSTDEEEVLKRFIEEIDKYDVICGWNSQEFDVPYIQSRMALHGMRYEWRKMIQFDLMKRLIKLFGPMMTTVGLPGFSLQEVSQTFLKESKVYRPEKIHELEKNNPEKLKEYNIQDTMLLYKLDKKLSLFDLMTKECAWTGTFLNKFFVGELLDNYILREAKKQNKHLPSQREWSKDRIKVKGAYVMPPITGLHENIRVFDFKSLYPSMIVTWNISHDTIIDYFRAETIEEAERKIKEIENTLKDTNYCRTAILKDYNVSNEERLEDIKSINETNVRLLAEGKEEILISEDLSHPYVVAFYSKRQGIYSDLIKYLLEMRKGYKKQQNESEYGSVEYNNSKAMQEVVKELSNSMYGITADPNARFFDKRIAESITLTGQFVAKKAIELFADRGYTTYYGDTDSMFVKIDKEEEIEPVLSYVNMKLKEHVLSKFNVNEESYIVELQYEKTFNPLILVEKKRYSGLMADLDGKKVNKIFTRGLEVIKKDTIEFTRKKLIEMLKDLLIERKSLPFFTVWLQNIKEEVLTTDIPPEDLKITKKVSKPISEYKKNKPIHVRLAEEKIKDKQILETQAGKHVWGQKIEYIITASKGARIGSDTIARGGKTGMGGVTIENFTGEWDRVYYWNTQVFNILRRILGSVFPDYDWEQFIVRAEKKIREKKLVTKKEIRSKNQLSLF